MAQPFVRDVVEEESNYGEGSVVDVDVRATAESDRRAHDRYMEMLNQVVADQVAYQPHDDDDASGSSGDVDARVDAMAVSVAVAELKELATRLQKIRRVGMLNVFARGRPARVAPVRGGPVRFKRYSASGSMIVNELDEAGGLYEMLRTNMRVVTTIVARTGIGKTTVLPSRIVQKTGKTVLLLEPDVKLARYAAEAASKHIAVRKVWAPGMTNYMVSMSYGEFYGHFVGENGRKLLESFDVVMMDECTVDNEFVELCRNVLATFGPPNLSVIECSATADDRDAQSSGALVEPVMADVTLDQFIDNGYLWKGRFAQDRTMVIAKNDQQAAEIHKKIYDAGFECVLLDSASRFSEVNKARDAMYQKSAVTNRFVVVVPTYGYGYNIPVNSVITSGEAVVTEVVDNGTRVIEKVVRLTPEQLKQHGGRAGREGNSGITFVVCSSDDNVVVKEGWTFSQRLKIYLMLIACNITVPSTLYPDVREALLPYGITKQLALDVLAINMPPEVSLRFFARDGRVPYKYVNALEAYTVQDYRLVSSEYDEPVDHDLWVEEVIGGYYTAEPNQGGATVWVPLHAEGDLRVILHAVATSAAELLEVENWRCSSSDTELDDAVKVHRRVTSMHGVYRPRIVEDAPPIAVVPVRRGFIYDVPTEDQRGGNLMLTSSAAAALSSFAAKDLDVVSTDFTVNCPVVEEVEKNVARIGILDSSLSFPAHSKIEKDVEVHSPGGSVVVSFRRTVWEKMVAGGALTGSEVRSFMNAVKHNIDGFVQSDAFTGWTDVWYSVFATMGDGDNLSLVKRHNLTDRLVALLMALVNRYISAVKAIARASYIHASMTEAMLSGNSFTRALNKQKSKGKLNIVQSAAFFERLFGLRDAMVSALTSMEDAGVFAPSVVVALQQLLPVMRQTGNKTIDAPTKHPTSRFKALTLGTGGSSWR